MRNSANLRTKCSFLVLSITTPSLKSTRKVRSKKAPRNNSTLDPGYDEKPDVKFNLDELTEEDVRDEDRWEEFWYLPMRQKSELLGLKVLAHSWESGDGYDLYERYDKGVLKRSKRYDYYGEEDGDEYVKFMMRPITFFTF